MKQDPARRLIDVLRARHQRRSGSLQRQVDLNIVSTVACEAVDLVNDDVGGGVINKMLEHSLEFGPIGALGALAAVDKLGHDSGAETFSLPMTRITLGRDLSLIHI